MRNRDWKSKISQKLRKYLKDTNISWLSQYPAQSVFWEIELSLFVITKLFSQHPIVDKLWIILTGYELPVPEINDLTEEQRHILANARHLLNHFRGRFKWEKELDSYLKVPEYLRGYNIDLQSREVKIKSVVAVPDRFDVYLKTTAETLDYQDREIKWATKGDYIVYQDNIQQRISISEQFANLARNNQISSHNLDGKKTRTKIAVTWEELVETAIWMDRQWEQSGKKPKNWHKRLKEIELKLIDGNQTFLAQILIVNGIFNLIGAVGAGKSTVMEVLAVWAAINKRHVTLIVPDVIDQLKRAQLFLQLGFKAAPILGVSNRHNHLNRLHRASLVDNPDNRIIQNHEGFQWVSMGCALNDQLNNLFNAPREYPCLSLYKKDENRNKLDKFACPLFTVCPTHKAAIDLVEADIWLATPASALYSKVPVQINRENLRYGELIYRRSDLVIWDEVDRGMVYLDGIFSPNEELIGFLDELRTKVAENLQNNRRSPLQNKLIDSWNTNHRKLQGTTDKVVHLLQRSGAYSLQVWLDSFGSFFSELTLFESIAKELCNGKTSEYDKLIEKLKGYLQNEQNQYQAEYRILKDVTKDLIIEEDIDGANELLINWLQNNKKVFAPWDDNKWEEMLEKLQFALLIYSLSQTLQRVLGGFTLVDNVLKTGMDASNLLNKPPLDFDPVIPVSPQGNVLGYQYRNNSLIFFKCKGVGRWITLHFHELYKNEGIVGPNVLLMSGTSWADASPGFHLQVPVNGILKPNEKTVENIVQGSQFFLKTFYYSNSSQDKIVISGLQGQDRISALQELIKQLAQPSGLINLSPLEVEIDSLPEGRKRILLLTGSYYEAELVKEFLVKEVRPDWKGQVVRLVPDNTEESKINSEFESVRRGNIEDFPKMNQAWILVAPLLAVERGHNILNEFDQAAIGTCYFLVRIHPTPDDLNLCVQMLNRWTIDKLNDSKTLQSWCNNNLDLITLGTALRKQAFREWSRILNTRLIFSSLPLQDKKVLTWNILVVLNQVIGRLNRGGCPARVYFCDAKFADLLPFMRQELEPYFDPSSNKSAIEQEIAKALYSNFYFPLDKALP
ncbi:MAG: hypothetical protein QNJ70_03045 [Xenococcaceae cyanobacterium MO_207.B15]|nr:hypothetical protein [Xenococcaceae cyanobacterium MO_207.B15]